MVIISNYRLVEQDGFVFILSNESSVCPICGLTLFMRSWRERTLINTSGHTEKLMIRRLLCDKCNRIHHELPDLVVPYKRHCADTIEEIITGTETVAPCCERTIRRILSWWCIVLPYFLNILKTLTQKHGIIFNTPPAFKEIVRAVTNSNNWVFVNLLCTRSV